MRTRRWAPVVLVAAMVLVAGACGGGGSKAKSTTPTTQGAPPVFAAGTAMAAIQARGKLIVGTKFDQPGFGQRNPTNGQVEGFDVEIAKLIAVGIFGGTKDNVGSKIQFVEAVSKNREPFIQNGTVDIVVATYTINADRKKLVDFAGPYLLAHEDILVKSSDNSIHSVTDLNGKKVCSVKGSTSEKNVKAQAPRVDLSIEFDGYQACVDALGNGRVEAVVTDNTILAGYAAASNGAYKRVNTSFSDEPYGIGLKKGDEAFRSFLNDQIERIEQGGEWAQAFRDTAGKLGLDTPPPPAVDRYSSVVSPTSLSTTSTVATSPTPPAGRSTTATTAVTTTESTATTTPSSTTTY